MSAATDREPVEVECGLCHGTFMMSRRGRRGRVARGDAMLCHTCAVIAQFELRPLPDPAAYYRWWQERFPGAMLDELLVDVFGAAAGSAGARGRRATLIAAADVAPVSVAAA